jgi:hypothetical protein
MSNKANSNIEIRVVLENNYKHGTTQPRRGTRDTKGKRMEMSLMKPAKLTLVRPLSALVVRFVPFCGYA